MESNQLRLYKHFKKIGNIEEAEQILRAYPQFEKSKEEEPKIEKNKK